MRQRESGFSIPELMIVMTLTIIMSGVLVLMYTQSELSLSRGVTLTTLEQTGRIAAGRIIPKITSAVPRPPMDLNGDGDANDVDPYEPTTAILRPLAPALNAPPTQYREIVLYSIRPYVQRQLRQTEDLNFNPRTATHLPYRIFANRTQDAKAPGGFKCDVFIDGDTPGNPNDDINLVRNLFDLTFEREVDNVIRLTVDVRGFSRRAIGGRTELSRRYVTRVYLPIFTHSPGGT